MSARWKTTDPVDTNAGPATDYTQRVALAAGAGIAALVPKLGTGAPNSYTSGNGAASAAQALPGGGPFAFLVVTEGPIRLRFGATPVSLTAFQLYCPAGTSGPYILTGPMTSWGEGGAWNFCLVQVS